MKVIIGSKNAILKFQGCTPDYIENVCHGRCCWSILGGKIHSRIYAERESNMTE